MYQALTNGMNTKGKIDPGSILLMQVKKHRILKKLIGAGFTKLAEELLNGRL